MRKALVLALVAGLMTSAIAGPALAGKKKKKAPPAPTTKEVTFEASGTLAVPAPTAIALKGLTEAEFTIANECASAPVTQGVDGYVVEIPADFRSGTATVEVLGADTTGAYDLDVYFYDASCGLLEPYMTDGADASGAIPPGAAWAVIELFVGANATFDLKATATVPV
jgi:hypothetical protein